MADSLVDLVNGHADHVVDTSTDPCGTGWPARHAAAWKRVDCNFRSMIAAMAVYADNHERRYDSKIGDDGVLGDYWLQTWKGVCGLLDGETHDLDCASLDTLLWCMRRAAGFEDDE